MLTRPSSVLVAPRLLVITLLGLGLLLVRAEAVKLAAPDGGLSLRLDPATGVYQVNCPRLDWTCGGTLGTAMGNVATGEGRDDLGSYKQASFEWRNGATPMKGSVRLYAGKPVAVFAQTCVNATEQSPAAFPDFNSLPAKLHVFSYGLHEFAPPHFTNNEISTPWMLFDDQANAFIVSPASHYFVASMKGDGQTRVASGFNDNLHGLPAGFTQQTLLAFGSGINKTWDTWGKALLALGNAKRPVNDADATLKYLGYWTDNGATYYYNYDFSKGYANTLQALTDHYRAQQIPIRYLQLDSWWYYKTTTGADGTQGDSKKSKKLPEGEWNRYGGLWEYRAHHDLFPDGLNAFQKRVGLPLVTHNRWVDPASPYHKQYQISGIGAVDPKWWDNIAAYMKESGIATYEQDWLDRIYKYSPAFSSNYLTGEAFLDNMARACKEQGITVQYCMPYPCHFLQGSRYENLTTIRTSGDRFNQGKWNDFLYTSRFASALGIWPWADVYMSTETNNVLLSTLSAGAVGIGDPIGAEHKANLLQAVRADGVIVKPDATMVPLDRSYVADATKQPAPLVASTYTDHDGLKTEYVFAFNRSKRPGGEVQFTLPELGLNGPAYVYDYFGANGKRVEAKAGFTAPLADNASAYYVVAPVGRSGIAFLGDKDKFVSGGRQRIASLRDEAGRLTVGVVLAGNEQTVRLHGYAVAEPKVHTRYGQAGPVQYDPATRYFTVEVKVAAETPVDKSGGDPVRRVTAVFEQPVDQLTAVLKP